MTTAQPVGAFPFPAGLLLLPLDGAGADVVQVAHDLLRGRLPGTWPAPLRGHEFAHAGRPEEAVAAFAGDDAISRWNRYVLAGPDASGIDADELRAALPADLAALVEVVRFGTGEIDDVPTDPSARPEVAALVLASQASMALTSGDPRAAIRLLHEAADLARPVSSAQAALLRGNAGALGADHADSATALEAAQADLAAAVAVLDDTDLHLNAAEFHLRLGSLEHERAAALGEPARAAMHHYHATLQLVGEHDAPQLWANAQLNLASAYLAAPMTQASDQLRHGIAVGSLRASLRVFTPQSHPQEWASATVNLANALVYAPSTHPGDNLAEAVGLYEEVLAARSAEVDPLGRARVLTNHGNALAHLGALEPATLSLMEARSLFEQHLDHDGALTVRSILDEIARQGVHRQEAPADGLSQRSVREVGQMSRMGRPAPTVTRVDPIESAEASDAEVTR